MKSSGFGLDCESCCCASVHIVYNTSTFKTCNGRQEVFSRRDTRQWERPSHSFVRDTADADQPVRLTPNISVISSVENLHRPKIVTNFMQHTEQNMLFIEFIGLNFMKQGTIIPFLFVGHRTLIQGSPCSPLSCHNCIL